MDFDLTEEQRAIREVARDFAAEAIAPHALEWVHQILEGTNEIMRVIIARDILGR